MYIVQYCLCCNAAVHPILIDRQYLIDLEDCQRMRTNYNQVVVIYYE